MRISSRLINELSWNRQFFNHKILYRKTQKQIFATFILLGFTIFLSSNSFAATLVVDDNLACPGASFSTIQSAISVAASGDTVQVCAGNYNEDVVVNVANLIVSGAGVANTIVSGPIGGGSSTFTIAASNIELRNFQITRDGNNTTDWDNPGLNSAGISIQGQSLSGVVIHDNFITGMRTAIDINNSNGHTIRNNVIDFNRTGMILRNQTDNLTVTENEITNNWTVGVVFLDASGGSNVPVQTALNSKFRNNNISENWYGQMVDRQVGGSLPPAGENPKYFRANWFGTTSPVVTTANSAEPGYSAQIPVEYGGTATAPGGQPDIAGPASANFRYAPVLTSGTDTDVETTTGRGTYGFQGNLAPLFNVTPATSPTATDNDYTRINDVVQLAQNGDTITLNGTFDWTEANAAASWALGSDGLASTGDEYSILAPGGLNGITITASSLGASTIQGPGDLAALSLEGVFQFYSGGTNQNWTISNLRLLDFDNPIGFYFAGGGVNVYDGTQILNNYIRLPQDLNATIAPNDNFQNIGLHYSFGDNILISGNTFDVPGNSVSDSANSNFATNIVMQSNTSGGAYEGLQITNNTINILNAQNADPEVVIGIWENGHSHTKNITVSGNQFLNQAAGNNPAANLQRGFRITSHSSATSTVQYLNNRVEGANIGFQWLAGQNFAGNQPIILTSNLIRNNATGVKVDSNGSANLSFNRIVGNSTTGVQNATAGTVTAENNWWGCNYGPGAGGAGCSGTANGILGTVDADPWLVLTTSASPNAIQTGESSTITSKLTINSDGVDTSAMGNVPDGTPAAFTATLGTVSPTGNVTTSGVTGTTFTAGAAAGSGGANTTIDGQTVNAPIAITFTCNEVSIPSGATVQRNTQFLVPVNVDDTTGRNIISYDFTITYNPAVVTFIGAEKAGTLSNGFTITTNNSGGTLTVSGFGTTPLTGAGTLLNLRFISTGGITTTSPLNFSSFTFNGGVPCVNTTNGDVTVASGNISGQVRYVNSNSPPVPVPNTNINAAGSVPVSDITNSSGNYLLTGFGTGAYTVTPSKAAVNPMNSANAITSFDAARIAQHVVGFITLNANQLIAADVSGDNVVSSFDAALIAQSIVGIANPSSTGTWIFVPASRSYPNVETDYMNQDYDAILKGEVTGEWMPPAPFALFEQSEINREKEAKENKELGAGVVTVTAPTKNADTNMDFVASFAVDDTTGEGIIAYDFTLNYDQNVITPVGLNPCSVAGTVSNGGTPTCNAATPGVIVVSMFRTTNLVGAGTLLNINFSAVGAGGTTSPLTISNFIFNGGTPMDVTNNGVITLVAPSAAGVPVSGSVRTANGSGISDARVTLIDSEGNTTVTRTSSFGIFAFESVVAGQTYTITVDHKRYFFTPQAIFVSGDAERINFVAGK